MALIKKWISLEVEDGSQMQAYVCYDSASIEHGSKAKGLMVFQEAFGVNDHIQRVCQRFAAAGYYCISPEFYHRTAAPGFTGDYNNFQALAPHFGALKDEQITLDLKATYNHLLQSEGVDNNQIASVGYCMGGRVSFLANTLFDLKAAISYYGGRIAPDLIEKAGNLHGPMLFYWGGLDKHIGTEQIAAVTGSLKAAQKQFTNIEFSYADHGFSCDARPAYNKMAAEQAWAQTFLFLEANMS